MVIGGALRRSCRSVVYLNERVPVDLLRIGILGLIVVWAASAGSFPETRKLTKTRLKPAKLLADNSIPGLVSNNLVLLEVAVQPAIATTGCIKSVQLVFKYLPVRAIRLYQTLAEA